MKLSAKEIFRLSHGALRYEETKDGGTALCRFTEKSRAFYDRTNTEFAEKTRAGASIRLEFDTDAAFFALAYRAEKIASRCFCFFDVLVDGVLVAHPGEDGISETSGEFTVELPEGTHRVAVYFPALFAPVITSLTFPDGAAITPVAKSLRLFSIGDSITHGYDARFPSQSYVNLLADKLGATVINQGIGAEVFNPDVLDPDMPFAPDIITVAFGTNDWHASTREDFERDAKEFYRRLRVTYPMAKLFAITPIWRGDSERTTKVGRFEEAAEIVRSAALAQQDVIVVDGIGAVPHMSDFFADEFLHPNDLGFKFYADALWAAMAPHLS